MERKTVKSLFVNRLDKLRRNRSNTEFAEFLGMSRQTIGFYLNGERLPDVENLRKISQKCNVSSDWLIGLSDIPSVDADMQAACKYLNVSEAALTKIANVLNCTIAELLTEE